MSFSLAIRHGDLSLNGNAFAKVSASEKVLQDLRCEILTPFQFYEKFPEFGTTLETLIGEEDWNRAAAVVRAEITRVCNEYQARQIARNQSDLARYGRMTIEPGEILLRVLDIQILQIENHLIAKVLLELGSGTIELNVPVTQ